MAQATSGGTQTLTSQGALTFTQLTTTGVPGDPGAVDLTSYAGAVTGGDIDANGGVDIHGQSVALDDVSAAEGPVAIVSATTLTGDALSTGGSASLSAGGDLRWSTLTVGTTLSAASTGGSLTIGRSDQRGARRR